MEKKYSTNFNYCTIRTVLVLLIIFMQTGCSYTHKNVKETNDENLLSQIALQAKDFHVAKSAIIKITDQNILAQIASQTENYNVAQEAVDKITNQEILKNILNDGCDSAGEFHAVSKIHDQDLLEKIAMKIDASRCYVGKRAVSRYYVARRAVEAMMHDNETLKRIAMKSKNKRAAAEAAKRINDFDILIYLVTNINDNFDAADAAVKKIIKMVNNETDPIVKLTKKVKFIKAYQTYFLNYKHKQRVQLIESM